MTVAHHEMMDGRLHVYKRPGSRLWQCSTFLDGRNWRRSTKTDSFTHAKDIAEDWYLELRGKFRAGILRSERTFAQVAEVFEAEFIALTEGERNAHYVAGQSRRLKNHLVPFFGKLGISEVTPAKVAGYRIMRRRQPIENRGGKMPARSTLHQEMVCLRQVLQCAVMHGWLAFMPSLKEPYKKSGKIAHRAWFSPEEYKQLYTATRERAEHPLNNRHKRDCEDLHDYVLFMANTGLRPDEAKRLEFRDVKIVDDRSTAETILEIDVRGKRGVGFCKSTKGAVWPYRRALERNVGRQPTDRVFPKTHTELFNTILKELNLKVDREGQRRTAYSLRHTYICLRLMEGADIYQIAKNCRTSVKMIEDFYASHIKDRLDAATINVKRPRLREAPKTPQNEGPAA